ncbi:translation initiation factor IF-2-like [Lutra lutra]|uniref:translation initiation factor IF-2-like n=1 Tax=Lutra lutra TaxID=9657 RepID=UPI001FD606A3|nr:translation initiation factor IF-2-like [Lutra lutra]
MATAAAMARVGTDSSDPPAQLPAHRPSRRSSALRARHAAPLKPGALAPPRVRPVRAPARSVPRQTANGEQGAGGAPREAEVGACSRDCDEGPTTALPAPCCRVLSPSPDPALLGDEVSPGCGCPDRASVRRGGTRPSGERSGGRRGLTRVPRGRARRSFPATLSAGFQEHVWELPALRGREAALSVPLPARRPAGESGSRAGADSPPTSGSGGCSPRGRAVWGGGWLRALLPPRPPGTPSPRPLLLGKPAGAAGGGCGRARGRAAQTTASPRRWAVGDSSGLNGPGRGVARRRGRTCRTGSGRPPSRSCGPPGACWSPGPGSSGAAWRLGAEGSVVGVRAPAVCIKPLAVRTLGRLG